MKSKNGSASRHELGPAPIGVGYECNEQPMDSDRKAKSQRRKAVRRRDSALHGPIPSTSIWQSEVRLKVVAGGAPLGRTIRHVSRKPEINFGLSVIDTFDYCSSGLGCFFSLFILSWKAST